MYKKTVPSEQAKGHQTGEKAGQRSSAEEKGVWLRCLKRACIQNPKKKPKKQKKKKPKRKPPKGGNSSGLKEQTVLEVDGDKKGLPE